MKPQKTRVAAYGITTQKNQILLARLGEKEKDYGFWTLPGGGLEFGEDPQVAVVREVFEETGLTVEVVELLKIRSAVFEREDQIMHALQIFYSVKILDGDLRPEGNGFTDAAEWHDLATLREKKIVDIVEEAATMFGF